MKTSPFAADDVSRSRTRASLRSHGKSGERWSSCVQSKAIYKPVDAIEWTPRDTILFKKLSVSAHKKGVSREVIPLRDKRWKTCPAVLDLPDLLRRLKCQSCLEGHAWILLEQMAFQGDVEMMAL